jgi:threonylcarbamoyladenosine tRNA methylthiotransferase MtaB
MGRTYDAADYRRVIERIASRFPEAGIGADVMVGFPGETEEEFESCRHLVASLPLSYLHVFTYSERSGTPATRMAEHVVPATKQARSRSMHALEDELRAAFVERSIGTEQDVLVEDKPGPRGGLTGTFIRVELDDNRPRGNEVWRVRITEAVSPRLARAKPLVRLSTASDIADQRTTSTTGIKRSRK